jgi:hypothetical protein
MCRRSAALPYSHPFTSSASLLPSGNKLWRKHDHLRNSQPKYNPVLRQCGLYRNDGVAALPRNVHARPDTLCNACVLQSAYELHKYNDAQLLRNHNVCCEHGPAAVPWRIFASSFTRCFPTRFFNTVWFCAGRCFSFSLWVAVTCRFFVAVIVH